MSLQDSTLLCVVNREEGVISLVLRNLNESRAAT